MLKRDFVVYFLILLFVIVASYNLSSPGLHYDEALFMNAALGPIDSNFVNLKIGSFPILLMDYIGALKAWLYYPIFKLFGVSMFTIRFPMILLTGIASIFLYKTIKNIFNPKVAFLTILLLVFDPSFMVHSRIDIGPTSISFFLRVMVLYFFFIFLKKKSVRFLFLSLFFLILNVYDKMNNIWFAISFILSVGLLYRKEVIAYAFKKMRPSVRNILIVSLIALSIFFLFLSWKFKFFSSIDFFYFKHLVKVLSSFIFFLNGQMFIKNSFGLGNMIPQSLVLGGFIVSLGFIGICVYQGMHSLFQINIRSAANKNALFFILNFVIILFQIIITSNAGASWHFFMLYPFITVFISYSICMLFSKNRRFTYLIAILILIYSFSMEVVYFKAYDNMYISPSWSSAIYDLIRYTQNTDAQFVSVDWGIHNQLQAFDHIKGKYYDVWTTFIKDPNDKETKQFLVKNFYRSNKPTFFILNTETFASFQQPRKTLFRIAKENNITLIKTREFTYKGRVIYELYAPLSN